MNTDRLPRRIWDFLNAGDAVVAEVAMPEADSRCFVQMRGISKPGIPREQRRYLNSQWSIWEYWDFAFRRIALREGWEANENDYDLYLREDVRRQTRTEEEFMAALAELVPADAAFVHARESACPL